MFGEGGGQKRGALYSRRWSRTSTSRTVFVVSRQPSPATLRSRATNSQARRFVIAIYDSGSSPSRSSLRATLSSPLLSFSLFYPYFPTSRALNGVLNNGFIYGA